MKTVTANKFSFSDFDNNQYIFWTVYQLFHSDIFLLQTYVESDGDSDSLCWFDPNQLDSQRSWHFSEDNFSELFNDSLVNWEFESNALPPPAKRMSKYCRERLNPLLDNVSYYWPPDSGLISVSKIRDELIPDDEIVDFDKTISSEEQIVCSLIDFEAREISGEWDSQNGAEY